MALLWVHLAVNLLYVYRLVLFLVIIYYFVLPFVISVK